nr:hypothetical protein [Tomitella gaofuii]
MTLASRYCDPAGAASLNGFSADTTSSASRVTLLTVTCQSPSETVEPSGYGLFRVP